MSEYAKFKTARTIICDLCNELHSDEPCEPADCDWLRMLEEDAGDVVTVVRCKDCKHYAPEIEYCGIHSHFVTRNGDFCYPDESSEWKTFSQEDYCSQGERKNDANEPDGA